MKDFDTARNERLERERGFRIGGHDFVYRASVAPEALLAWDDRGDLEGQAFLDVIDETVIAFLEPGQDEKWREARSAASENPLNISDIIEVIQWLFEEQVGRPTGRSSESTNGGGASGTPLTVVSSSPATPVASGAST